MEEDIIPVEQTEEIPTDQPQPQQTSADTDWPSVAEMIANELQKKGAAFEVIEAPHSPKDELRIVHQVTDGELLISFLLLCLLAFQLLQWLFRVVWRR